MLNSKFVKFIDIIQYLIHHTLHDDLQSSFTLHYFIFEPLDLQRHLVPKNAIGFK